MKIEEVIKKAIKSGWKPNHIGFKNCKNKIEVLKTFTVFYPNEDSIMKHRHTYEYFLDPQFWQSLGRAEGWKIPKDYSSHRIGSHSDDYGGTSDYPCDCDKPKDWQGQWHKFIDTLASGKTAKEFFKEL